MNIDRQALLEQKRQRLLELKQRRLQKEKEDAERADAERSKSPNISDLGQQEIAKPQKLEVKRVDVSVQVGESTLKPSLQYTAEQSLVLRFDKVIQVEFDEVQSMEDREEARRESDEFAEPIVPHSPEPLKAEVVNEALASQLEEKLRFPFSKLRLGIREEKEIRSVGDSPFVVEQQLGGFLDRPIVSVKTTPQFPELILVAYGASDTKLPDLTDSKGLAIIFNTSTESIFPEFFLHCTSPIAAIAFDKTDAFRIICGMENGRLALWDLTNVKPNQLAVLPTLQSSTLASLHSQGKKKFTHHTMPIVLIKQPEVNSASPSVVSISAEGVINVWSLSILARPKLDSRVVKKQAESERLSLKDSVYVTSVLISSHYMLQNTTSYHAPEYKFLNNTYLGCDNGEILKLKNDKDKSVIDSIFSTESKGKVTSLVEFSWKRNLRAAFAVVSSHMDWSIKIWQLSSSEPVLQIPTTALISKLISRPGHCMQMVALNQLSPPEERTSLDFWNLNVRCFSPTCSIPLPDDFGDATLVEFNSEGDKLFVSSRSGRVVIWNVDKHQLDVVSNERINRDIDGGIMHYLKSTDFNI